MTSYRSAGVDLEAADRSVAAIAGDVTATWSDDVVGGFGGFAAGLRLPEGYERPVMMMSTDGVGTKAEIARAAGMVDGLGFDLVAMCVDDLAAAGARPVALTDYIAVGSLDEQLVSALVSSVARACAACDVALLGGETAEHPGVMEPGTFDLSATALGLVEDGAQVTGELIEAGDVIIGLSSPNVRSNGFSLIRALPERPPAETLLEPSVIYAPALGRLLDAMPVHGMAHITGGGIPGNLVRPLPEGTRALVEPGAWTPPPVFDDIAAAGEIDTDEMFRVFNMGIGFAVIVAPDDLFTAMAALAEHEALPIGTIVSGERGVELV
ncbi:MAG: phosphoribosylformylglycinamidine cyclo-ligase [Acidimicrobiia bacterium]|nr:phosphoribosylformylglycinamidine cyclo-ligase [Acidimicrobiia bacterium]NNF69246.1 phosphoribosylformylglycinamidine cyclo-ligase [Acidimicrobiia bacterium]NNK91072.1 phosphoribosylformylglycinamidine cyclo-ligase [Acidimicrobiia bacterium]